MSCCDYKGQCTQAANCETRGSYQPRRSCAELGTCRDCVARCLLCENDPNPWSPDEVECTPFEKIAYWLAVLITTCLTGGAVVGGAAFIYGRWFTA